MKAKTLILFLLLYTVAIAQTKTVEVTRTCIVCGQEWTDSEQQNIYLTTTGTMIDSYGSQSTEDVRGEKWYVYLHDNAYLCRHCYNKYAEFWRDGMKAQFNMLLKSAIEEQKDYALKVQNNIKIKRLKELEEKLNSLKKEIDEAKK